MDLEEYAKNYQNSPKKIDIEIKTLLDNSPLKICEIGCGDGGLALEIFNTFKDLKKYIAFDPSESRLARLKVLGAEHIEAGRLDVVSDIASLKFQPGEEPDLFISEQVIEHVIDDFQFLKDIRALCGRKSIVFISTVYINGPRYYFYKNDQGMRVLDPTHIREYSDQSLVHKIRKSGFHVVLEQKKQAFYPFSSLISRLLRKLGINIKFRQRMWVPLPFYYHWRIILVPVFE